MNEKNQHGSIFKKLREERGYKLKDVAGDVISTRTLMRFEADETSISLAIFEKLLENCGISHLDYLAYYYENSTKEIKKREHVNKYVNLVRSGSFSEVVNECKKELKKTDIYYFKRLETLFFMDLMGWKEQSVLFNENKRIIKEKLELTNKLGWDELFALKILITNAKKDEYSVEYIDRIIDDCLKNISTENNYSRIMSIGYCALLHAALAFLSRNGYFELGEKRCKETLQLYKQNLFLMSIENMFTTVVGILAKIYLRQNKKEGVELASKYLKYNSIVAEISDSSYYKQNRDINYKSFCEVNKTGLDIEF